MDLLGTLTLNTAGGNIVITVDDDGTVDLPTLPNGWDQEKLKALFRLLDVTQGLTLKYAFTGIHFVKA